MPKLHKYIVIILLIIHASQNLFAQDEKLSAKKERLRKEIEYTNQLLIEARKNKTTSFNNLLAIKKKIANRKEIISTINKEIEIADKQIEKNEKKIDSLEVYLKEIKSEYEKMINYAYKNKDSYNKVMFVLAAESFNQAYKRLRYIQQYSEYRQTQFSELQITTKSLQNENAALGLNLKAKEKLLKGKKKETDSLELERKEQTKIYAELKKTENSLLAKIEKQQKSAEELSITFSEVIAEKNAAEEQRTIANDKEVGVKKAERSLLSAEFTRYKGKLSWPVKKGIVVGYFGEQEHALRKGVMIRNDGIDISTTPNTEVVAIFKGVVSKVITIPGANKAVLINHGDYYTIYSNLSQVDVKVGDEVKKEQKIGIVYTDTNDNNLTLLKFQLWHQYTKLNPLKWIKKK